MAALSTVEIIILDNSPGSNGIELAMMWNWNKEKTFTFKKLDPIVLLLCFKKKNTKLLKLVRFSFTQSPKFLIEQLFQLYWNMLPLKSRQASNMPVPIPFLFLIPHSLTTSGYFLFSVVGCDQGKPTSSSWNSLSHKGSQDHSSQPESGERSQQDVYRKWTTSLLYSASIKGNSVEYFLEGVIMSDGRSDEAMHTHTAFFHLPFIQWHKYAETYS